MDDQKARGERVAGHIVLLLQLVSWAAFLGALGFGGEAFSKPEYATPAAVMMIAAALGFGLLANAVLRR